MKKQKLNKINEEISEYLLESNTPKIIKVIWDDATTISGTSAYEDIIRRELVTANTIGYLVYENEKSIAICGFVFPDRDGEMIRKNSMTAFNEVHIIPKRWIKNVIVLKNDYEESKKFRNENKDWFIKY